MSIGFLLVALLLVSVLSAQEAPEPRKTQPFHNQLFFNRFLINPTFSLVRENKSYLNVLLRNQHAGFEDNNQNYFVGFSNKLDQNTALGLGIYGQWSGVIQEFGFHANYATAVQLGDRSALSFGANINYTSRGLDKNRVVVTKEDPMLDQVEKTNTIGIAPGMNLSLGRWDFGVYFADLLQYNQTLQELEANVGFNYLRTQIQYAYPFSGASGILKDGRLVPLVQAGKDFQNQWAFTGSLLLDLPKIGWAQATYDQRYGMSTGLGFNLNKKLSLGYLMEKGVSNAGENLGWNHELSLAYTMDDELRRTGINVQLADIEQDNMVDEIVRNYEQQLYNMKQQLVSDDNSHDAATIAQQNRMLIDELILRQDSLERLRNQLYEKRFESIVRILRKEIKGERATPEQRTKRRFKSSATGLAALKSKVNNQKSRKERFGQFNEIPIRVKNRSEAVGVNSGFYLIANVFKSKSNARAFIADLAKKGLEGRQFLNRENGFYYVYLADFNSKNDADVAVVSNMDGAYKEDKWIMQVYNTAQTAQVSFD